MAIVCSFVADCLTECEGHDIRRANMFKEYDDYCAYYERVRVKKKTFFDELKAKGFVAQRVNNEGYVYKDIIFTVWKDEENNIS